MNRSDPPARLTFRLCRLFLAGLLTALLVTGCSLSGNTETSASTTRATGSTSGTGPSVSTSRASPTTARPTATTPSGGTSASAKASATPAPSAAASVSASASTGGTASGTIRAPVQTSSVTAAAPVNSPLYNVTLRRDLLVLLAAYPDALSGVEAGSGKVWLLTRAGGRVLYDDHHSKSFDGKLNGADLQDSLEQGYPLRTVTALMPANIDPGRFRCYPLLDALYGASEAERYAALVRIPYGTQSMLFSRQAGAADSFGTAAGQVAALVQSQPGIGTYAYPSSGTWISRNIAGTTRPSAHGFGIAIDLHAHVDDYWVNARPAAGAARLAAYPAALVQVFENNGFIWGGKWNHFDIMHYEYRPELLLKARWFSGAVDPAKPWHQGADTRIGSVARLVALIDSSLKDAA